MIYAFNDDSRKKLSALPIQIQAQIMRNQQLIEDTVQQYVPGAVCTSGFRDPGYNLQIGGKTNSLHIWGGARDYRRDRAFPDSIPGLVIVLEADHYHVQMASGV